MSAYIQAISAASLPCSTEAELAAWRRRSGVHVVYHAGHYWQRSRKGFYEPVHLLGRLRKSEISRPTPWCWGFKVVLAGPDEVTANGSTPVNLAEDVAGYSLARLRPKHRWDVLKGLRHVSIVQVLDAAFLQTEGYRVYRSAMERTNRLPVLSDVAYRKQIEEHLRGGVEVALAALAGKTLVGYLLLYTVGQTAYLDEIYVESDALRLCVPSALFYEATSLCGRTQGLREVNAGLFMREHPKITAFKERHGFCLKHLPSTVEIYRPVVWLLRRLRPHQFFRLTGHD